MDIMNITLMKDLGKRLRVNYQKWFNKKIDQSFDRFFRICREILNINDSIKEKHVRGNHFSFMNKTLSKEIMKITILRNKVLKNNGDCKRENTLNNE